MSPVPAERGGVPRMTVDKCVQIGRINGDDWGLYLNGVIRLDQLNALIGHLALAGHIAEGKNLELRRGSAVSNGWA